MAENYKARLVYLLDVHCDGQTKSDRRNKLEIC